MPIEVTGIEEIIRRLDELGPKAQAAIERAGGRAAAKVLLQAQRQAVPVESGRLLMSLGMQTKKVSGGLLTMIGPDKRRNFLGRFHEFGTKYMAGIHWMQKAFDSSAKAAQEAYIATVKKLLDKPHYDDLKAALQRAAQIVVDED